MFFQWLKDVLITDGWVQAGCDPFMFLFMNKAGVCIAVIYVDDGIIAGPRKLIWRCIYSFGVSSRVVDLCEPEHFLGMNILRDRVAGTISVHQAPYVQALVNK